MSRLAYTLTKVTCTNLHAGNLNSLLTLLPITRLWVKCEVFPAHIFAFYSLWVVSSFSVGLITQQVGANTDTLSMLKDVWNQPLIFISDLRDTAVILDCTPYMNHGSSGIMKSSLCHIQSDDLQVIKSGTCTAEGTQSCTDCVCAHRNKPVFTCYERTDEKHLAWQLFNLGCN